MSLASFFESIPEKQRNLQLGLECDNPMSGAFPHKRVVHAGLNGTLVSPKETQSSSKTVRVKVLKTNILMVLSVN